MTKSEDELSNTQPPENQDSGSSILTIFIIIVVIFLVIVIIVFLGAYYGVSSSTAGKFNESVKEIGELLIVGVIALIFLFIITGICILIETNLTVFLILGVIAIIIAIAVIYYNLGYDGLVESIKSF